MSAHTPAPWRIHPRPATACITAIERHDGWLLAIMAEHPGVVAGTVALMGDSDIAQANARLIAAAPVLLAALQNLTDAIGDQQNAEDQLAAGLRTGCAYHMARAAIAKATGE